MPKYNIIIHYQDKVCVVEAENEYAALQKAEESAYSGIEISGMEVIESVKDTV
jgi:hypothetical protein